MYSRHNSNYWKGISYLGIGPSAHSFNGETRQWNISNNAKYIESMEKKTIPAEVEVLTKINRLNEYIMTSLRTSWGMDLNKIGRDFGSEYVSDIKNALEEFVYNKWVISTNEVITLTQKGKLFADRIAAEIFAEQEI
jgi:oxygen-independent coproporphyrinogen-3 oxidase